MHKDEGRGNVQFPWPYCCVFFYEIRSFHLYGPKRKKVIDFLRLLC